MGLGMKKQKMILFYRLKNHNKYFGFLRAFIFFIFYLFIFKSIFSQNTILKHRINIEIKNSKIYDALNEISKQTNYFFTYDAGIISSETIVNIDLENVTVADILSYIFKDKSLNYKVIEDHIVIFRSSASPKNNFPPRDQILTKNIILKGKIIDADTELGIPFVSLGIIGKNTGTATNENGEFKFNISEELSKSELLISHIGYKKFTKPVEYFIDKDNIISLQQNFISIQEVIIRNNNPVLLIKSALRKKNKNYSTKPYKLTTYYREVVKKKDVFLTFFEAVPSIYKTSYSNEFNRDKIKIIKSRKVINNEQIDTIFMKLKGGLESVLTLDFMKNPIDFLMPENMKYYNYRTTDIVSYNEKSAYVIEFEQKNNVKTSLYKGKIYIETESYAIVGSEFEVNFINNKDRKKFVVKKHRNIKTKTLSAKYKVFYRKNHNKYMLNHVRIDLRFRIRRAKSIRTSNYHTFIELAVCNADSSEVKKFSGKEIVKTNKVFIDTNFEYDETFWETFNYIVPETPINETLKHIKIDINECK